MMRVITAFTLALALSGSAASVAAQSTAKEEIKKAGSATKDAGKDLGKAAVHTGKAAGKATKNGAKAAKKAMEGDAHATCMDGTRQAAETEAAAAAACDGHGGVKKG